MKILHLNIHKATTGINNNNIRKGVTSIATAMLVDMVGEAGGLELAVLVGGAVLGVLLGGVARLGCSCGLVSQQHLAILMASAVL